MIGYLRCRDCGTEMNAADLVAKLCPACLKKRTARLSALQGQYEQAVRDGNADRAATAAEQVRSYQQAEGVRLRMWRTLTGYAKNTVHFLHRISRPSEALQGPPPQKGVRIFQNAERPTVGRLRLTVA